MHRGEGHEGPGLGWPRPRGGGGVRLEGQRTVGWRTGAAAGLVQPGPRLMTVLSLFGLPGAGGEDPGGPGSSGP